MKQTPYLLSFALAAFFGCDQEYATPDSAVTCPADYQTHDDHAAFQALVDDYAAKGIPGITLFTQSPDRGVWAGAAGFADIEDKVQMTACHLHHTASLYKTFIAVVVLQLVDEGKVGLDQPFGTYLPEPVLKEMPNGRQITIRQALYNRTGLVDIFELDFILDFFNDPSKSYTIPELLAYMDDTEADSAPGTDFYYSDANFVLLSLLVSELDGNYEQSLRSRIFQPVGMTDTHFIDEPGEAPAGLADSYWDRFGDGKLENVSDIQIATTAGLRGTDGIISSASDLARFMQALAGGSLISTESLAEMTAFIDVPEKEAEMHGIVAYGLGLMMVSISGDYWYGHFGNHVGSAAMMLYNPARDMTLVAFINKGTFFSDEMKPLFFGQFIWDVETILYGE